MQQLLYLLRDQLRAQYAETVTVWTPQEKFREVGLPSGLLIFCFSSYFPVVSTSIVYHLPTGCHFMLYNIHSGKCRQQPQLPLAFAVW